MTAAKGVSFCLAAFLIALILVLNFGFPDEALISFEEYRKLLESGRIESAVVVGNIFHGKLYRPVKFRVGDRPWPYERIVVDLGFVDSTMMWEWEHYGVDFRIQERRGAKALINLVPWIVLFGFLSLGVWHIVGRAKSNRRLMGGPGMWQLERMRDQGSLTEEEYQERRKKIIDETQDDGVMRDT